MVLSKLTWKTHQVENINFIKSLTLTSQTNRPLIGKTIGNENAFKITRLRPLSEFWVPKLIVSGQIENSGTNNTIILKYRTGLLTTIFITIMVYSVLQFIWAVIFLQEYQELISWSGLRTLIVLPSIVFFSMKWEFSKTSRTINQILDLNG